MILGFAYVVYVSSFQILAYWRVLRESCFVLFLGCQFKDDLGIDATVNGPEKYGWKMLEELSNSGMKSNFPR